MQREQARGTLTRTPHFPERGPRSCTSGPLRTVRVRTRPGPTPVGVGEPMVTQAPTRNNPKVRVTRALKRALVPAVGELDDGLEPRVDELVEDADDAVELRLVEVLERDAAGAGEGAV